MTWVFLSLAVLAVGATASLWTTQRSAGGLFLGLAATGAAGVLCILAGGGVLLGAQRVGPVACEWPLPLGEARFALDGLSAWFLIVIGAVTIPVSFYSGGYFAAGRNHGPPRPFAPLLCILIAAMILVVAAADAVLFLVGWELMSLSAFFLVGLRDQEAEARRGAWMYLVATHLGTAIGVLPLFAAFVARSGSTEFAGFGRAFAAGDTAWCIAAFGLGVIGFGAKAGFMPFHVWLPAAHPVAPSPVSALMSGVVIKIGIYGFLRSLSWLPPLPAGCGAGLLALAMFTGVMGILHALGQDQIKRMLAYSSVENIGIIGMAIALGALGRSLDLPPLEALGFGGALLHVLNHSLFKGLLFLSAGAVLHDAGTGHIEKLGGLARHRPVNALAFLVGAVAICALPPLNGFLSELLIYTGLLMGLIALPNTYATFAVIATAALALIGGLALVGFSKVFAAVFLGEPRNPRGSLQPTPRSMHIALLLLALACVGVGFSAGGLAPLLTSATQPMMAESTHVAGTIEAAFAPLARVGLPLGAFVVIALILTLGRRRLPRGAPAGGSSGTWGCGFAAPASRMQYTASSYSQSVIRSFRPFLRLRRCGGSPAGCFPRNERLSTHTTDLILERFYLPLFRGASRGCERMWPLQHGRIQLYLMYIVITLAAVFGVEAVLGPVEGSPPTSRTSFESASGRGPTEMTLNRSGADP